MTGVGCSLVLRAPFVRLWLFSLKSQAAIICYKIVYCKGTSVSKGKESQALKSMVSFGIESQIEAEAAPEGAGRANVAVAASVFFG